MPELEFRDLPGPPSADEYAGTARTTARTRGKSRRICRLTFEERRSEIFASPDEVTRQPHRCCTVTRALVIGTPAARQGMCSRSDRPHDGHGRRGRHADRMRWQRTGRRFFGRFSAMRRARCWRLDTRRATTAVSARHAWPVSVELPRNRDGWAASAPCRRFDRPSRFTDAGEVDQLSRVNVVLTSFRAAASADVGVPLTCASRAGRPRAAARRRQGRVSDASLRPGRAFSGPRAWHVRTENARVRWHATMWIAEA